MDKWDEEKWCSELNWWQARRKMRYNIVFDFTAVKQVNTFSVKLVPRDYYFEIKYVSWKRYNL